MHRLQRNHEIKISVNVRERMYIGQSAAKLQKEEGSETILYGVGTSVPKRWASLWDEDIVHT